MLNFLLGLIPSAFTAVNNITNAIANEKIASLNASTDQQRIASQERVNTLQAQRDVLIADSTKSKLDIVVRTALAFPIVFILNKTYVYDKIFDGTTLISTPMWTIVGVVASFYFVQAMVKK